MSLYLEKFSFRFAEQVLNSKLNLLKECESILTDKSINIGELSRPGFNKILREKFVEKGWESEPKVFHGSDQPDAKMDFLKDRIGIEVEFGHATFMGLDLLKFQVSSYSELDHIDAGIYVTVTKSFQRKMQEEFNQNWEGSLTYEKVVKYLPYFKSAIQVPILVYGIDIHN